MEILIKAMNWLKEFILSIRKIKAKNKKIRLPNLRVTKNLVSNIDKESLQSHKEETEYEKAIQSHQQNEDIGHNQSNSDIPIMKEIYKENINIKRKEILTELEKLIEDYCNEGYNQESELYLMAQKRYKDLIELNTVTILKEYLEYRLNFWIFISELKKS